MASSAAPSTSSSTERSCLCGTVNAPSASPSQHASSTAKCKICRTKPKFSFLRGQRSFDLGQQGKSSAGLNGHASSAPPSRSTEEEVMRNASRAPPQARRARSAERYEGLRVHERTASGLPRQRSLQTPVVINVGASSDPPPEYMLPTSSPPPPYEVVKGKMGHPPTYEECLAQRLQQQQQVMTTPTPPPLPRRDPAMPSRNSSPPPPWSPSTSITPASQSLCNCPEHKNGNLAGGRAGGLRVNLPPERDATPPRDRVDAQRIQCLMLAADESQQTSSSYNHRPCSNCQSRYGTYKDSKDNFKNIVSAIASVGLLYIVSTALVFFFM